MRLDLAGPAGRLEALLDLGADPPRAAVVFGHPHPMYGGTMHTRALYQAAKGLTRIGCSVLRFNFRGVGRSAGTFGQGTGEMADYGAALDFMAGRHPNAPLWAAGYSFGSWIALETGSTDPRVSTLIGIAPPVKHEGYAWPRTLESEKPKFLVQGDMDELCPIKALWAFYAQLKEPKELAVIEGASHLFDGKTAEVGEALEDLLGDYE